MEPESIKPIVLTPQMTMSPSLEEPTILSNKLDVEPLGTFGLFSELHVFTSPGRPSTEEVKSLKKHFHS